jgi:hypothetical protein
VDVTGTEQTLFTLDMIESLSYRQTVKARVVSRKRDQARSSDDDVLITDRKPLSYWTEMVDLLGRSPIAWYSVRGRSVATLARQHCALLMPPGGPALARVIQERLAKESPKWEIRLTTGFIFLTVVFARITNPAYGAFWRTPVGSISLFVAFALAVAGFFISNQVLASSARVEESFGTALPGQPEAVSPTDMPIAGRAA